MIQINRQNYEGYFLMYVDNELSAQDRAAVDQFVSENPDLETELELLTETTLPAESITYSPKSSLYREETIPTAMQEQLLLQLDNELDAAAAKELTLKLATDKDLSREWNILQQTRLDANDTIVFEDKQLLYRKERDRVIPMFFWRIAAAVVIIGMLIVAGYNQFMPANSNHHTGDMASQNNQGAINQPAGTGDSFKTGGDKTSTAVNETSTKVAQTPAANISDAQASDQPVINNNTRTAIAGVQKDAATIHKNSNAPQNNDLRAVAINGKQPTGNTKSNNQQLPSPGVEKINNDGSNKKMLTNVQQANDQKMNDALPEKESMAKVNQPSTKQPVVSLKDEELTPMVNSLAKTAAVEENNTESNDNSILFIKEEKVNRTKIGGLFRKVKRVLTRNANITNGGSVGIAGFEIATR
ncbi:MAG: hypothetical protein JST81_10400 [Bacteroidetes bacterium]|nr:hypothetical protein [Bacteroidota bacterium]